MSRRATRDYNSPLRAAQVEQTRELILDALAELVADDGFAGVSVKDVAERSGVSERTVYRHFADRRALEEALVGRLSERYGWDRTSGELLTTLDAVPAAIRRVYRDFDREADGTRIAARVLASASRSVAQSLDRGARFVALVDEALPHLPERDRLAFAGVLQVLGSSRTWLRLADDFGVDGEEAGRVVAWLAELAIDELAGGATIPDER